MRLPLFFFLNSLISVPSTFIFSINESFRTSCSFFEYADWLKSRRTFKWTILESTAYLESFQKFNFYNEFKGKEKEGKKTHSKRTTHVVVATTTSEGCNKKRKLSSVKPVSFPALRRNTFASRTLTLPPPPTSARPSPPSLTPPALRRALIAIRGAARVTFATRRIPSVATSAHATLLDNEIRVVFHL